MRGRPAWSLLALLSLAACTGGGEQKAGSPTGIGRQIAAAEARALLPSADGGWLAWLDGCRVARGQFLPPGTANCDLRVAPSGGGSAARIAGAVTTLPQGLSWSPTGATLVTLADYDYAAGSGTLVLWREGGARELAQGVTFHGFGPGGELGFVSGGKLSILLPGEEAPREVEGAIGVASFDFAPVPCPRPGPGGSALRLAARRSRDAGGQLLVVDCALTPARTAVTSRVADYGFSGSGGRLAYTAEAKGGAELHFFALEKGLLDVRLGSGVVGFAFAPDGHTLAYLGDVSPGRQGNLYLAEPGKLAARGAKEVGDFRWAAKAPRVAWLEGYDPRVRSGVLGVGGPGAAPRTFGRNVTDFDIASDGKAIAYLQHTARGGYSVDLFLARLEGAAQPPQAVAQGVFGFAFSPDGRWLYYRTRCTRNGEGCELERVPASGLAKDGKPELLAQGMKSFEFDPRDADRLLVGWQRMDRPALDVGVWQGGTLVRVDQTVLPGSARFLGPDSRRVAYAVTDPKRAGVYVAEPAAPPR